MAATAPGSSSAFRGHLAAASLKLDLAADAELRVETFPRPFGRGLIEANWFDLRADAHARFPRPFGRGLIEAVSWRTSLGSTSKLSAAIWPRPH